jgi:hypothetical protein
MTSKSPKKNLLQDAVAFLLGGLASAVIIFAAITTCGMSFGPDGFPLLPEDARQEAEDIARLTPFPKKTSELSMTSRGGAFGHQFQIAFFGDPIEMSRWVDSCPDIKDPQCTSNQSEDGSIRYRIPERGGSNAIPALIHYPDRGTLVVEINYM